MKLALADEPIAAPTQLIPLARDLFQFNKDTIYLSPAATLSRRAATMVHDHPPSRGDGCGDGESSTPSRPWS